MSNPTGPRRTGEEVLGRVLGPSAPELSCEECFAEIDRFVELEVAAEDADAGVPGMRAHLAGCPACAEEYSSLRDLLTDD
jgi:hypothetical protein